MFDSSHCEKCGTVNWVNHGDMEDQTAPDVEAFRCFNCKHINVIAEEAWLDTMYGEDWRDSPVDALVIENGFKLEGTKTGRLSSQQENYRNLPRSLGGKEVTLTLKLKQTLSLPNPEISPSDYDAAQRRIIENFERQGWSVEVTGEEV